MEHEISKLPRLYLERIIIKKLAEAGIHVADGIPEKIVEHLLSGSADPFRWDDGGPSRHVAISISDSDIADMERSIEQFSTEQLPAIIQDVIAKAAVNLRKSLVADWPEQHAYEQAQFAVFRSRLQARWQKPFDLLRMLLTISRELGEEFHKRKANVRSRPKRVRHDLLTRLHARACQVTAEIITLMENGYADGAIARWRTLHEIHVVASLIATGGEDLARRYVDHHAIEAKRGLDQYQLCHADLGYRPVPKATANRISRGYNSLIAKYGKSFVSQYGWAAQHLNIAKPNFTDLERASGRAIMRSHYKWASDNVHAGPKGLFVKLGQLDPSGISAGASNVGFSEPGQNTAHTLLQITTLLLDPTRSYDDAMAVQVLADIQAEIPYALARVERSVRREDAKFRRKRSFRIRVG